MKAACLRAWFLLLLSTLVIRCDGNERSAAVKLTTDAHIYRAGTTVRLLLTNNESGLVGYNLCFVYLSLERRYLGMWEETAAKLSRDADACYAILEGLRSGESVEGRAYLPPNLQAGTYRISTHVDVNRKGHTVSTEAFEVQ